MKEINLYMEVILMTKKNLFIIIVSSALMICFSIGYSIGYSFNYKQEGSIEKTAYDILKESNCK